MLFRSVVLQLGLKSTDLKLLTAVIVALALAIPVLKKSFTHRHVPLESKEMEAKDNA